MSTHRSGTSRTRARQVSVAEVRERVLRQPKQVVELLLREPSQSYTGSRWSAMPPAVWHTLLAEAYQRLNDFETAYDEVGDALEEFLDSDRDTSDEARIELLPILAVHADLSVCVGDEDAVECCDLYRRVADRAGDQRRTLLAEALQAVGVYQQEDAERGRDQLGEALRRCQSVEGDGPVTRMLTEGIAAMAHVLAGGWQPPRSGEVCQLVVPGGRVCPDTSPRWQYLASRIRLHPPAGMTGDPA